MADPTLIALISCDAAAFDPAGKVTLYGVFDAIYTKQVPTRHGSFTVFCKCRFLQAGEATLAIYKPDGSPLVEDNTNPMLAQGPGAIQAIYTFAGLEFPEAGEYELRIKTSSGNVIARAPLLVQMMQ